MEARAIISRDQVHLHNEFLLCLFNKVQGLAEASTPRSIKVNNSHTDREKTLKEKRVRLKRKYKTDKSNFEVSSPCGNGLSGCKSRRVYSICRMYTILSIVDVCRWLYS